MNGRQDRKRKNPGHIRGTARGNRQIWSAQYALALFLALIFLGGCGQGAGTQDSAGQSETDSEAEQGEAFSGVLAASVAEARVGDIVLFGTCEINGDAADGVEAIEWIVLEKTDGAALLVSRYALEYRPFHSAASAVTWEECTLRLWLNEVFYQVAFQDFLRDTILTVRNETDGEPETVDRVFLLSAEEAALLADLAGDPVRTIPTAHARETMGEPSGEEACAFLLRTPGAEAGSVLDSAGNSIPCQEAGAICPAVWVAY